MPYLQLLQTMRVCTQEWELSTFLLFSLSSSSDSLLALLNCSSARVCNSAACEVDRFCICCISCTHQPIKINFLQTPTNQYWFCSWRRTNQSKSTFLRKQLIEINLPFKKLSNPTIWVLRCEYCSIKLAVKSQSNIITYIIKQIVKNNNCFLIFFNVWGRDFVSPILHRPF